MNDLNNINRATPDQIAQHINRFVGSSGGGQWAFELLCKYCRDLGTISAKKHTIGKPKELIKASQKFVSQGWLIEDNQAVCPRCYKKKHLTNH